MQPGKPQPPTLLIFQWSVSVKWIWKYTHHFQTLLKASKTLNEIVQSHYCFIPSTFTHPQLNISGCKLVLMGKMLSMTPESKWPWKSLSSESNGGIVFASPDICSPSKAQQGQNIFLPCWAGSCWALGPQDCRVGLPDFSNFNAKLPLGSNFHILSSSAERQKIGKCYTFQGTAEINKLA